MFLTNQFIANCLDTFNTSEVKCVSVVEIVESRYLCSVSRSQHIFETKLGHIPYQQQYQNKYSPFKNNHLHAIG